MKTKLNPSTLRAGDRLTYNDGRDGHCNALATVLAVYASGMLLQFDDRAQTTSVLFSEHEWMENLATVVNN